jgi:hypothetical protein
LYFSVYVLKIRIFWSFYYSTNKFQCTIVVNVETGDFLFADDQGPTNGIALSISDSTPDDYINQTTVSSVSTTKRPPPPSWCRFSTNYKFMHYLTLAEIMDFYKTNMDLSLLVKYLRIKKEGIGYTISAERSYALSKGEHDSAWYRFDVDENRRQTILRFLLSLWISFIVGIIGKYRIFITRNSRPKSIRMRQIRARLPRTR